MTTADILEETYTALSANKVRSGLTILGIVIGISSVIALVSIGQGAQASIQTSIQSIGSNLIMISPGAAKTIGFGVSGGRGTAQSLTGADSDAIATQVANISEVADESQGRDQVSGNGTNTNTSVDGVTASYADVRNVQVSDGTFITDTQNAELAKVAVLGPTAADDLIATGTEPVGQLIRINGQQFTVVGVTVSKGSTGFTNQDDIVYIPIATQQLYLSGNQYLSSIDVEASSPDGMTQVQNDITTLLLQRHNIS